MSEAASTSKSQGEFFFGWDLLYKTIESTVNKNSDVLIALAHFVLIKHSKLNCIGVGEDKTLSEDEIGSELLPDGWNDDDNKYALRYMFDNKLYLLLGHITEDCLIINLLDVKTKKVSNIGLDPAEFVKKTKGPLKDLLPSASQLVDRYRRELIEPVFTGNTKEVTTQTLAREERSTDPLRIGEPMRPPVGQYMPVGMEPRPFGFPDVGRGDLDPLGRGGPGNLFPFPSRPDFHGGIGGIGGGGGGGVGGQPRFDPYGPPEANLRPNPNPDHLQPPGFGNNDYYM